MRADCVRLDRQGSWGTVVPLVIGGDQLQYRDSSPAQLAAGALRSIRTNKSQAASVCVFAILHRGSLIQLKLVNLGVVLPLRPHDAQSFDARFNRPKDTYPNRSI